MELKEKLEAKHKLKVSECETNVQNAQNELEKAKSSKQVVARVIHNIGKLRQMDDVEVRKSNLPYVVAGHYDRIDLDSHARPDNIVDYSISERLDDFNSWLVNKHDWIYNVKFAGGMAVGRNLREGWDSELFDDGAWDALKKWIQLYCERNMKEDLYNSIMNDNFDALYSKLVDDCF